MRHLPPSAACCAVLLVLATPAPAAAEKPPAAVRLANPAPGTWIATGDGLVLWGAGRAVQVAEVLAPERTLARLDLDRPIDGAFVRGRRAFLVTAGSGVTTLDLADPTAPRAAAFESIAGAPLHFARYADELLASGLEGQPARWAIDGRAAFGASGLERRGPLDASGPAAAVLATARHGYVVHPDGRADLLDLSDPAAPRAAGSITLPVAVRAAAAEGTLLHVATPDGELVTWDLERPSHPRELFRATGVRAAALAAAGRVVLAAGRAGLVRIEIAVPQAITHDVDVSNTFFSPAALVVAPGDTVHWNWVAGNHSTTSGTCGAGGCAPDGTWDSGVFTPPHEFSRVFPDLGAFPYYCTVHGAGMKGTITVSDVRPLAASTDIVPAIGPAPLDAAFTATVSGGTPPYRHTWNFGDGARSTDAAPHHTYQRAGRFKVTLAVSDSAKKKATVRVQSSVEAQSQPRITAVRLIGGKKPRLVISGSGFERGARVTIGATELASVRGSAKTLNATDPQLAALLPAGTPVEIVVSDPSGLSSAPFPFTP